MSIVVVELTNLTCLGVLCASQTHFMVQLPGVKLVIRATLL